MGASLTLITLAVEDWYESVAFYNELLGLKIISSDEWDGRARLQAAPGLVLELLSGGWGSEEPKAVRQNPVSLCLRVEALALLAHELEHRGVCLLGEPEDGLLALMDPEGNRLYLYDTEELPRVPDGCELQKQQESHDQERTVHSGQED